MSKLCKSCGNYYEGDHCDKCGYGDPNLKTHAADKYKKPTKPERFRTEEEKELYAEWEKEKKEDTEIKRHYDPNAGKKTLAIVAVVVIGVIVAVLYKSGVIFSSTKTEVIEKYFKSIQTSDFDSFVECFPKEMKNEYEQQRTEGGYGKEQVMKEVLYGDFIESYGSDYTIDVSFGRETKLKESEYDLSEYKSFYGSAPNVSEAYEIVTNVTFKGSKGSEDAKLYIYVGNIQRMTSLATMSNINTGSDTALAVIQQAVKSTIYQDKLSSGAMTEEEMNQLEDPVLLSETTVVGDKADKVSSSVVMSLCSAQSRL